MEEFGQVSGGTMASPNGLRIGFKSSADFGGIYAAVLEGSGCPKSPADQSKNLVQIFMCFGRLLEIVLRGPGVP